MQGSLRFFKILKKSSPIRTDLPVPNSPARIIIVFRGIPLGRTLSRASTPAFSTPGKFWQVRTKPDVRSCKINDVLPLMRLRSYSPSPSYRRLEQSRGVSRLGNLIQHTD